LKTEKNTESLLSDTLQREPGYMQSAVTSWQGSLRPYAHSSAMSSIGLRQVGQHPLPPPATVHSAAHSAQSCMWPQGMSTVVLRASMQKMHSSSLLSAESEDTLAGWYCRWAGRVTRGFCCGERRGMGAIVRPARRWSSSVTTALWGGGKE
jgi:hypothetical protein